MSNPAERIAWAIGNHTRKRPTRSGTELMCHCPAHEDRSPSLTIRWENEKVLYKCHAGCSFDDIAAAVRRIGLNPFTGEADNRNYTPNRTQSRPKRIQKAITHEHEEFEKKFMYNPTARADWFRDPRVKKPAPPGYNKQSYLYRDENNVAWAVVHRHNKIDPLINDRSKTLIIMTPWTNRETGKLIIPPNRPPYPIPCYGSETLTKPGPVLVVEGEKCRNALNYLIGGRLPVITPLCAKPEMANFKSIIRSGRRLITMADHGNGDLFIKHLNDHVGFLNTPIPSPWRLGDMPIPNGWDIADEIQGIQPYKDIDISPLTLEELIEHLIFQRDNMLPGLNQDTLSSAINVLLKPSENTEK